MTDAPFNKLTPAEAERLALLVEESGETIQAIGKILRHGYESRHPDKPAATSPTNRDSLERELGDLRAACEMMVAADDLRGAVIDRACTRKKANVGQYLHHQQSLTEKADGPAKDEIARRIMIIVRATQKAHPMMAFNQSDAERAHTARRQTEIASSDALWAGWFSQHGRDA